MSTHNQSAPDEAINLPEGMFDSDFVKEAEAAAHAMLNSGNEEIAEFQKEKREEPTMTVVGFSAKAKNNTEENTLGRFVRPGHAPIMAVDAIDAGRLHPYLVDNLPMIVVNKTNYGVVTAITPVVFLEKTGAVERLRDAYGCLKAHLIAVTPRDFKRYYQKLVEIGRIDLTTPESPTKSRTEHWATLVEMGCATGELPQTLDEAILHIRKNIKTLTDSEQTLAATSIYHSHPLVTFKSSDVNVKMEGFPILIQKAHRMTPVSLIGKVCTLAIARAPQPDDKTSLASLEEKFCFVLATADQINHAIAEWEAIKVLAHDIAGRIEIDTTTTEIEQVEEIDIEGLSAANENYDGTAAPGIVELVRSIIFYGIRNRATDIHIADQPGEMMIRFRIDGFLSPYPTPIPAHLTRSFISRIKILAGINTQKSVLAQDGRINIKVQSDEYDVRVSVIPTGHGEFAVLRLLKNDKVIKTLDDLGFKAHEKKIVRKTLDADHGMLVVCGPTGSGKSTTLAAAIGMIDLVQNAVISGEQPIERKIAGINQVEVTATAINPKGLGFANFVEASLRLDPDVIIIGEVRDGITAKMSINAALTGHSVLSTLHTNSAPAALGRLVELGVEPFLLKEALKAVIAQRLIAKVCTSCSTPIDPPDDAELVELGIDRAWFEGGTSFMQARGCAKCRGIGYFGLTAIVEGFMMTRDIKKLVGTHGVDTELVNEQMLNQGGKTLYMQICALAAAGITDMAIVATVRADDEVVL